jgi:hypothetical protein
MNIGLNGLKHPECDKMLRLWLGSVSDWLLVVNSPDGKKVLNSNPFGKRSWTK